MRLQAVMALLLAAGAAQAESYTTFKVPGTKDASANAINNAGIVAGGWRKRSFFGGFVSRPGSGLVKTSYGFVAVARDGTALGGSDDGITGRAFLLAPNGMEIQIGAPDSGARGTFPLGLSPKGAAVGYYFDRAQARHSFLRKADGTYAEFDPPGCARSLAQGVNASDLVVGVCEHQDSALEGFLRAPDGTFTAFSAPGYSRTQPTAVNAAGTVAGWVTPDVPTHGFVRLANGDLTVFDVPGALNTLPLAINKHGTIAGYFDGPEKGHSHGFIRASDGSVTVVDVPGGERTSISGINDKGVVVGSYVKDGRIYGFSREP